MSCIPDFIASIRCRGTEHNGLMAVQGMSCNLMWVCGEHFIHGWRGWCRTCSQARADTAHPMNRLEQGTRADYSYRGADKILIQIQKLRLLGMNPGVYHIE